MENDSKNEICLVLCEKYDIDLPHDCDFFSFMILEFI